ncbi:MAG: DUF167 family protein [Spongiibacteraceae bacterium]
MTAAADLSFYHWQQHKLVLFCYLQPKASCDEFVGPHANRLKIRITAPPVDGKANQHLIKFIAKQFGVAKSAVTITSGELGRQKTLCIDQPSKLPPSAGITGPE